MAMNLVKLFQPQYTIQGLVDGYDSLIWAERFGVAGTFQLKSTKVQEFMGKLPVDSLFSLVETDQIMIVETHDIAVNEEGFDELTVTGRSFESFLENREWSGGPDTGTSGTWAQWVWAANRAPCDCVALLCWTNFATGSAAITLGRSADTIPNMKVAFDGNIGAETLQEDYPADGDTYSALTDRLAEGDYSVRVRRPPVGNTVIVTFDASGNSTRTSTSDYDSMIFHIFKGNDRTSSVVLTTETDNFINQSYLFSKQKFRNVAYVETGLSTTNRLVYANGGSGSTTGIARRGMYVDAKDIEENHPSWTTARKRNVGDRRGRQALRKVNKQAYFDGEIASLQRFKYGVHYSLGDKVTVRAKYGISQTMIVSEYIRVHDQNGYKEYPTLALPS